MPEALAGDLSGKGIKPARIIQQNSIHSSGEGGGGSRRRGFSLIILTHEVPHPWQNRLERFGDRHGHLAAWRGGGGEHLAAGGGIRGQQGAGGGGSTDRTRRGV